MDFFALRASKIDEVKTGQEKKVIVSLLFICILATLITLGGAAQSKTGQVIEAVDDSTLKDAALVELELLETQTELLKMKLELLE